MDEDERWPPFNDNCMDCKWWFPVTPFLEDISDTGCGECRYGPPTVISSYGSRMSDCKFPVMSEYDWCGRFERRTQADEEVHRRLYERTKEKQRRQNARTRDTTEPC